MAAKRQEYIWRRKSVCVIEVQGRSHGFQMWICTLENRQTEVEAAAAEEEEELDDAGG